MNGTSLAVLTPNADVEVDDPPAITTFAVPEVFVPSTVYVGFVPEGVVDPEVANWPWAVARQ